MGWNYRVMRTEEDGEPVYAVHEVHYDGEGNVNGWTQQCATVLSESRESILLVLAMMAEAVSRPTLDFETGKEVESATVLSDSLARVLQNVKDELEPVAPSPRSVMETGR